MEVIRLLNAEGEVVHSRVFLRDNAYANETFDQVTNLDGTRAFLFISTAGSLWSSLKIGNYRFQLTWHRDIGATETRQMRYGFSDDEVVQLDFSLPAGLPD